MTEVTRILSAFLTGKNRTIRCFMYSIDFLSDNINSSLIISIITFCISIDTIHYAEIMVLQLNLHFLGYKIMSTELTRKKSK